MDRPFNHQTTILFTFVYFIRSDGKYSKYAFAFLL